MSVLTRTLQWEKTGMKGIERKSVQWWEGQDCPPTTGAPPERQFHKWTETNPPHGLPFRLSNTGSLRREGKPHKLEKWSYVTARVIPATCWAATTCQAHTNITQPFKDDTIQTCSPPKVFMARCVAQFRIWSVLEDRQWNAHTACHCGMAPCHWLSTLPQQNI